MHRSTFTLLLAFVLAAPFCGAQTAAASGSAPVAGGATGLSRVGEGKRPMTFEDMMKMKRLGETAVAPDGKWLAYGVTTVDLAANTKTAELWLQAIAPPSGASQTSSDNAPFKIAVTQPGDSGVQFSADGKRILFLSSRDGGKRQVFMADFDAANGDTSNVKRITFIASEADNARWTPDGKSVVFTSAVYPECPAIRFDDFASGDNCNINRDEALANSKVKAQLFTHLLYRHWNHFTGEKRSHLFLATLDVPQDSPYWVRDLTPNDPHDVPPFSIGGEGGFAISPDSKELAFTENPDAEPATSTSAQIYTLDLTNPGAQPVKVSTSAGGNFDPAYAPDGKWLAWRSQARAGYESDEFQLMLYSRHAHKESAVAFRGWVNEFAWSSESNFVYFTSGQQGSSPVYASRVGNGVTQITTIDGGEYSGLHALSNSAGVIATRMSVRDPQEVVELVEVKAAPNAVRSGVAHPPMATYSVTHLNDALLAQLDLSKLDSFWFAAEDKTKLQGFIIRPPGFDAAKKYPVKFLIHGGPQGAWGDSWSYRWNAELLAANSYVVIMINPRGSTGYGQAVVDGVNGDWGGKPFSDLMLGLDYAEQHYPFVNKDRECALGASYGGYMANWILGHSDRFKCIVSHDGMFNAESAFGSTEEDWFNVWEFKGHPWDYYGRSDAENPFRKWSPSLYAKNFKTPTLVIHSQLDYRLDVSEGFQLFDTLQLLKVPSKMLYFPDEGHWIMKPQNSQLWYKTVNDWVDQWAKR